MLHSGKIDLILNMIRILYMDKNDYLVNGKKVYFIRHNTTDEIDKYVIRKLAEESRIGLFYENQPFDSFVYEGSYHTKNSVADSVNKYRTQLDKSKKKDFKPNQGYATSLNYIRELSLDGGYIFVEYNRGELGEVGFGCYFCEIEKNTNITSMNYEDQSEQKELYITLKYKKIKELKYSAYPALLAARPTHSTLCIPRRVTFAVVAKVLLGQSDKITLTTDLLSAAAVEQMCVEYLRSTEFFDPLDYCLLRPGRSLASIDIAGVTKGGHSIYGQVKNSVIKKNDLSDFQKFCKGIDPKYSIVFSKKSDDFQDIKDVTFHFIEDIFDYFLDNKRKMIEALIGIDFSL